MTLTSTATSPAPRHVDRALASLVVTTSAYLALNGAGIFETAVVVPAWAADPPASLKHLEGPSARLPTFWITAHTLHELTFVGAVALCWRLRSVRRALLLLFTAHMAVRVWTLAYFAPTIIGFWSGAADEDLARRVATWRRLNQVRTGIFVAISLALVPLTVRLARDRRAVAVA